MLRNVILAPTTAHNNAMNYLEGLGVVVTLDISYKEIKLPVKVWYIDYITMQLPNVKQNTLIKHTDTLYVLIGFLHCIDSLIHECFL